jgi:hypothetical protein
VAIVIGSIFAILAVAGLAAFGPSIFYRYAQSQSVIDARWPAKALEVSERMQSNMRALVISRAATTSSVSAETPMQPPEHVEKPALLPTPPITLNVPLPRPRAAAPRPSQPKSKAVAPLKPN